MAKILVIDDDPALRGMLKLILEKGGYSVSEAGNGREGVSRYKQIFRTLF
jgi:CheY-like chemotaxis protein